MDHQHEFLGNHRTFWPDVIGSEYAEFLHGKTLEDRLHVLGINVFPFLGDDHVLFTAAQMQVAGFVEAAQVPGHQPAVNDGFGRELRVVQVTGHHRLAAHRNFSDAVGGRIHDPHFHARQWLTDGVGTKWFQVIDGDGCARLREAVTVRDWNSQVVKKLQRLRLCKRAADDDGTKLAAKGFVYSLEQAAADAGPRPAFRQSFVDRHEHVENL